MKRPEVSTLPARAKTLPAKLCGFGGEVDLLADV